MLFRFDRLQALKSTSFSDRYDVLLQNHFVVYVLFVLYEIDTNITCEDQVKLLGNPREDRFERFRSDGLWRRAASKVIPTLVPPTAI